MEKIVDLVKKPIIAAALGLLVGLIIGLPILGWGIWPVKWVDADAKNLREDLKTQYLCMVVDSYKQNGDPLLARSRLDALGIDLANAATQLKDFNTTACNFKSPTALSEFLMVMGGTMPPLPVQPGVTETSPALPLPTEQPAAAASTTSPVLLLVFLCVGVLVVGGVLVYVLFLRNRKTGAVSPAMHAQEISRQTEMTDYSTQGKEAPLTQFSTTYLQGDDLYDDSISIDSSTGIFLGECGVGISDTIGVGDPKKVTAVEVWLFDKDDIQTVTKVLMSTHGFNDPTIRQRLASKGEPVLATEGQSVVLRTAKLEMEARVVKIEYGQGALPAESFFKQITIELSVWAK